MHRWSCSPALAARRATANHLGNATAADTLGRLKASPAISECAARAAEPRKPNVHAFAALASALLILVAFAGCGPTEKTADPSSPEPDAAAQQSPAGASGAGEAGADLLKNAASAKEEARFAQGIAELRKAEKSVDRTADAARWAAMQHALGELLDAQGLSREAEKVLRGAIDARKSALGPEHVDTLASRSALANALKHQRKFNLAAAEHRAVLAILQRAHKSGHRGVLKSRFAIADVQDQLGPDPDSRPEYTAIRELQEKALGADDRDTLQTRFNHAESQATHGNLAAAEAEHRAVLAARQRVFGGENPDTIDSRVAVAQVLSARGNHDAADAELASVLKIRERLLGPEHPHTLQTRFAIGLSHSIPGASLMWNAFAGR